MDSYEKVLFLMKNNNHEKNFKIHVVTEYIGSGKAKETYIKYDISRSTLYGWVRLFKERIRTEEDTFTFDAYFKLKNDYKKVITELEILKVINAHSNLDTDKKMTIISNLYGVFPVKTMCRLMDVNHSTFYNYHFRRVKTTQDKLNDDILKKKIKELFIDSDFRYVINIICGILKNSGVVVSLRKVSDLMKEMKLSPILPKKKTFIRKPNTDLFLFNHLKKNFKADFPNQKWVGDITSIRVDSVFYYLCVIIDLFSRKVVAYRLSYKNNTNLVMNTLKDAFESRGEPIGLLFHSDRGTQYTSYEYISLMRSLKIKPSYSNTGNPYDNAVVESFFSHMKKEEINRYDYLTLDELKASIDKYMDYYNNKRVHKSLGYLTPNEYEKIKV